MAGAERRRGRATFAWLLGALLLVPGAGPARAADAGPIEFEVTVVQVSPSGSGVDRSDARARRVDQLLGRQLRYQSLKVLDSVHRQVPLGGVGTVRLPSGRSFRFRPVDVGPQGVLVSVDLEKTAQGDFRIPRGKPLVLGGHPYEDGQLVVILEPDY